jgi:prepilin-type N-terminal cleavage/methylation domain-containing protein
MRVPRYRDERGFTLTELLIAMTIGLVVVFAALGVFEGFNRGIVANTHLTDAQGSARRDVSTIVGMLRDAGVPPPKTGAALPTIVSAAVNDIVFRSTTWPGESATGIAAGTYNTERICLDTATQTIWFDGIRAGAAGTTTPGSACPSVASGWTHTPISRNVVNTAAKPIFRLTAAPIIEIGVTLWLEGGTSITSHPLELNSGGSLRGAVTPPVTAADVTVTCNSENSGRPLLTLATPALLALTTSTIASTPAGAGKISLLPGATGNVGLTITDALGLQTLLFKQVNC